MTSHMLASSTDSSCGHRLYQVLAVEVADESTRVTEPVGTHGIHGLQARTKELSKLAEVLAPFRASSVVTSRLEISWIRSTNSLH